MQLVSDPDLDVASNAVAAAALLAKTSSSSEPNAKPNAVAWLCKALGDFRSYVRANALAGLGLLEARCDKGAEERRLLAQDPSEIVRQQAARLLARESTSDMSKDDARALSRCVADDKSGMVAVACRARSSLPTGSSPSLVFVVPDGRASPLPSAAYSLARADGIIRSGLADRRGAVFERAAPKGDLRLVLPGALAP